MKTSPKHIMRNKRYRKAHPEAYAASVRKCYLMFNYGLTIEEWNSIFTSQDGRCAICGIHQSELGHALDIDHRHADGYKDMLPEDKKKYIRKLLCRRCNIMIGSAIEDPNILRAGANYLDTFKKEVQYDSQK